MPYSPLHTLPIALIERAKRIRLACFDVDGTLTDGRLYYDQAGHESKAFHVLDGQGLKQLEQCGIRVALITALNSLAAKKRAADLGLHIQIGVQDKRLAVQTLAMESGIGMDAVLFMGDDLADLPALLAVGLPVAPANAHPWITERVTWHTCARGGEGAAREVCDVLLAAQDKVDALLRKFVR
ncbi:HAD family hydrolase [Xylella taiwanensis]|uniref:3-deoxy-D-manno-octulosonate 8-phosphate phosphatase KdsC n=1 Tax=Xylella taiwanensis TaxID=1444770 RepID=Z9JGE7_9GAMM|nr:HAD family hydrolase [Xylella taiwanensis]AXI83947.1 3-deoxy-D-manno-octulosonate 8-phosphate phosphatase [Xylella taiwanensis]EWS77465.1 HAD family hydrolase [Xylella taiwanensis]MCD8457053.1 HAD family hydrolase [Xylella taiwanensis]MCD8459463.1 HAD family hydrolase [Xylella taiwanensis]MCD8461668.1 HAD family hydrolase [Xylella taiwanensis]